MLYATLKVLITSVFVVAISETAKRSTFASAVLASIPLTSVLALLWLYVDTGDREKVASLTQSIFWLVLPSLVFFLALPPLLRRGLDFYTSLGISVGLTVAAYFAMAYALRRAGLSV